MKKIDLIGKKFGRLIVIKEYGRDKYGHIIWECKCDCGNIINVCTSNLNNGGTLSCG